MKKLLASDFDGTLSIGGKISDETKDAIRAFRADGGVFGIVTGRSAAPYLFDVIPGEIDFILSCSGALFILPGPEYEIFASYGEEVIRGLWAFAKEHSSGGMGPQDVEHSVFIHCDDPECDDKLEEFLKTSKSVQQCNMLFPTVECALKMREDLIAKFGDFINPVLNGSTIDIPAAPMNKAAGVRRVAEHFGVSERDIFAAGDYLNDLPMVEAFHGFAMAHGADGLKEAAEYVVDDVAGAVRIIMSER